MKASAIVCAVLAGSLGFGTLASAQDRGGRRDDGPRAERRDDRQERRAERQERRDDRRFVQAPRNDRRDDRRNDHGWHNGQRPGHQKQPVYVYRPPVQYQQPAYVYRPPVQYQQPRYYSHAPRFQRGGYLPHEYRQPRYYVNDWHRHRGLYAPPQGYQWMQVGTDFVLVALATGLIANLLMQ